MIVNREAAVATPWRRATTSTEVGLEPDLLARLPQRGGPHVGVDGGIDLAARERDLPPVGRHRLRAA